METGIASPCSFAGTKRSVARLRVTAAESSAGVPTWLVDARRIGAHAAVAIDEQPQRDVPLHLPCVERGRDT